MQCDECGFVYDSVVIDELAGRVRAFGARYRIPLSRGLPGEDLGAVLRAHPFDDSWSALEYACHVRDVFAVQRTRLARALVVDGYEPEPMRREDRVVEDRYNDQDPAAVADDLAVNADWLAADVEAFDARAWERTMTYNFPERGERPLSWVVRHTVHEGEHHLLDIGRVMKAARGR